MEEINSNIAGAAKIAGKSQEDITMVAVTKYANSDQIEELYRCGVTEIGENQVQSVLPKMEQLEDFSINWHFVGHLQSNKVKYVIDKIKLFQSLDRVSLAKELNKRAERHNRKVEVLVQVNIAGDEQKYGLSPEETKSFYDKILEDYPNISIKGLMTMIPYFYDPEEGREYYEDMRELFEKIKGTFGQDYCQYLSMGMSHDYYVAIEEGANMVRIGRSLFKNREEVK